MGDFKPPRAVHESYLVEHVLRPMCEASSQAEVAKRLGYSKAFISDVLALKRGVSWKLAKAMGYSRCIMFRKDTP